MDEQPKSERQLTLERIKERAHAELEAGGCPQAVASLLSDFNKHDGFVGAAIYVQHIIFPQVVHGLSKEGMKREIDGFN